MFGIKLSFPKTKKVAGGTNNMLKSDDPEAMDALLEKAYKKVEKLTPEVILIEFGEYRVANSKGTGYYTVQAGETDFGEIWIGCQCKGSAKNACYHMSSAWPLHRQLYFASAEPKVQTDISKAPYLKDADYTSTSVGKFRI